MDLTLILFSSMSATISLFGMGIFFLCILLKRTTITDSDNTEQILALLTQAQRFSVVFAVMAWLTSTFLPWEECLAGYIAVSELCTKLSGKYFLCGIGLLLGGLVLNLFPRQDRERAAISRLLAACLRYGIIFRLFSIVLTGL